MIFWKTQVIRGPFVHEGERAGRESVPGIGGNHVERALQLCFGRQMLARSGTDLRSNKQPEFCTFIDLVPESHQLNSCGNAIKSSHADPRVKGSPGCEGPLPRGCGDGSVLFQKETAPV